MPAIRLLQSPLAKSFLNDGVRQFLPTGAPANPHFGRRCDDAYGHIIVSAFSTLPKFRVSMAAESRILERMRHWIRKHGAWDTAASGDPSDYKFTERELGPIRHLSRCYKHEGIVGTIEAWLINNGRGGAHLIFKLTESAYIRPTPSVEDKRKYPKDWKAMWALPWDNKAKLKV